MLPTDAARWKITSAGRAAGNGCGVAHVALDESHLGKRVEVLAVAGLKIVQHGDFVAFGQQQTNDIGADKASSAGNECFHECIPLF